MHYASDSETAEVYSLWTAIALVSAALGGKCWTEVGSRRVKPNLYIVLVGESGSRKSESIMQMGMDLVTKSKELVELLNFSGNKFTKEALLKSLAGYSKTEPITGHRHSTCAIFSSEMEVMLSTKSDNRDMAMMLTELYDGSAFKYETKGSGVDVIPNPCVSLLAGTTPSSLGKMLDNDIIEAGFAPRMLFVMGKQEKVIPFPEMDPSLVPQLHDRLVRIAMTTGPFKLSAAAKEYYAKIYIEMRSPEGVANRICPDPKFKNWYARKQDFIIKLSTCIAASYGAEIIEPVHMHQAVKHVESLERGMSTALGLVGDGKLRPLIERIRIVMHQRKSLNRGRLLMYVGTDVGIKEIDEAIRVMKDCGELRETCHNGADGIVHLVEETAN